MGCGIDRKHSLLPAGPHQNRQQPCTHLTVRTGYGQMIADIRASRLHPAKAIGIQLYKGRGIRDVPPLGIDAVTGENGDILAVCTYSRTLQALSLIHISGPVHSTAAHSFHMPGSPPDGIASVHPAADGSPGNILSDRRRSRYTCPDREAAAFEGLWIPGYDTKSSGDCTP